MRIVFFGNCQSIHLQRWVEYFIKKGDEVHILTMEPFDIKGAEIHDISYSCSSIYYKIPIVARLAYYLQDSYELKKLIKLVKSINPDLINAHYLTNYGILASRLRIKPMIITPWGSDILIAPEKFGKKHVSLMKNALKNADAIIADGENVKTEIIKLGIDPHKIKLIIFGVDTKEFTPENKLNNRIFDFPVILSVRQFEEVYDVSSLINAIPAVLEQFPGAKFIIHGRGSQETYLKNLAKNLGIWDNVRFMGWSTRSEFIRLLASADIYVSISLSDGGISVSTLEAMASELPVVVTDAGDNRNWIQNGENGFIVPIKDPHALAEKIIYLLEYEDVRKKFGKINRKIIEEKANYYKEMEKVDRLYKEIIALGHDR